MPPPGGLRVRPALGWAVGTQPPAVTVQVPHSDGPDQLLCEVPFSGDRNGSCTTRMLGRFRGCGLAATHAAPVRHRSQPSLSPWKTQCAQSNQNWLNAPPWHVIVPTGCESPARGAPGERTCCAGLGAHHGQHGTVPRDGSRSDRTVAGAPGPHRGHGVAGRPPGRAPRGPSAGGGARRHQGDRSGCKELQRQR